MRTFTYICLIGAALAAKLNPSCDPETGVDQNGVACVAEEIVASVDEELDIDIDEAKEKARQKCRQGHLPSCALGEHRYVHPDHHNHKEPQPAEEDDSLELAEIGEEATLSDDRSLDRLMMQQATSGQPESLAQTRSATKLPTVSSEP